MLRRALVTLACLAFGPSCLAQGDDACARLLAATTPVKLTGFVKTAWRTGDIHRLVDELEQTTGATSFRVPLGFGRTLWVLQDRALVRAVMASDSRLPYVNRNFDASHGHYRSINSVDTDQPLWDALHGELKDIFATHGIAPLLEKHRDILLGATRFNLNDTLARYYLTVWAEYCFGPVDHGAFKMTRDRLIAVLGKVFHQNRLNRVPVLGAITSRLNRVRHRGELTSVDAELEVIVRNAIAAEQGVFAELHRRLAPNFPDAFAITRDNAFLAILVYDFIHIVMLDTLAHAARFPDVSRQQHFVAGRHHAFLYPFRFRVLREDHEGFRRGDFAVVNLQKTGLYFSAGKRVCPGAGLFNELSTHTLALLREYDLRLVDPAQDVVRGPNRDLPFLLSDHDVVLTKCPFANEESP